MLNDGTVLVVGGNVQNAVGELYEPGAPAPVSIQIAPSSATIVDGNTQTFSAVDDQGQTRTDAIWTVSDSTTASLQSPTVPTLTGIKPGQVLLTADVDGVETQIQVNIAPSSLQITPVAAAMLIGDSRQFTVVDEKGRPSEIATWSVDNASLATITSDAAPTLTAAAAGTVNLTATVEGVSTQIPITISGAAFAPGTVLWSAPPAPGFTPQGFFQALPTDTGPNLYTVQTGSGAQTLVQALTSDGQQLWQTTLPFTYAGLSVPDGFGGMLVVGACDANNSIPMSIVDVNPQGATAWQAQVTSTTPGVCPPALPKIAIGQDGAVVVSNVIQVSPALVILDGPSGATISAPTIPASTFTNSMGQSTSCDCFSIVGQPMVDTDGSVNVEYEVRQVQFLAHGGSSTTSSALSLLHIAPDYTTTSTVQLGSQTFADLFPANVIPDGQGQGGTLATWSIVDSFNLNTGTTSVESQPYQAAHVSGGAIASAYPMPMAPTGQVPPFGPDGLPIAPPMVLGDSAKTVFTSYGMNATSFQLDSGAANWNYQASAQTVISVIAAVTGGNLTARITDQTGQDTLTVLDSGGGSQGLFTGSSNLNYSWTADWYAKQSSTSISAVSGPLFDLASVWAAPFGGPSASATATAPIASQLRVQLAATALGYVGSQNWLDDTNPNNPAPNKCNIFVHDMIKQVGLTPPQSDKSSTRRWLAYHLWLVDTPNYPAQAGDWANPQKPLKGWQNVAVPSGAAPGSFPADYSLPGDVIAEAIQYSDATGHVGIIANNKLQQTISADSAVQCYAPPTPAGTITNTDYGFRPDNYVDPSGCRTHGLKKYAVVKRFVGQ